MAQATTYPFSGLKVLLDSTPTPGTFATPCGITERSFTLSKETNDASVPDCTDEDAAAWVERDVSTQSASISGEGVMAQESLERWRQVFEDNDPVLTRVLVSGNLAANGGYWEGLFHLTSFEIGATKGERATVSIEMLSSGAVDWTDAAA